MTEKATREPLLRWSINVPTLLGLLTLGATIVAGWTQMGADIEANKLGFETNVTALASVKLEYIAAVNSMRNRHQTDVMRLVGDIKELDDNMTGQAISLGKIEANQANMLRAITSIDNKLYGD